MTGPAINAAGLDELEALLANATLGEWMSKTVYDHIYGATPWIVQGPEGDQGGSIIECGFVDKPDENAAAIVALHNAAPALIALARQALPEPVGEVMVEDAYRAGHEDGNFAGGGNASATATQEDWLRYRARLAARLTPATDAWVAVREETIEACAKVAEQDYTPGYGHVSSRTADQYEHFCERQRSYIADRIRALGQAK